MACCGRGLQVYYIQAPTDEEQAAWVEAIGTNIRVGQQPTSTVPRPRSSPTETGECVGAHGLCSEGG